MRNDSLSAPTPAQEMAIEEQRRANDLEHERLGLERSNRKILKANTIIAAIAAIAALMAAIASIACIFVSKSTASLIVSVLSIK